MMENIKKVVSGVLNCREKAEFLLTETYFVGWFKDFGIEFRSVDSYGGEGKGDNYWNVLEMRLPGESETVFVKLRGWYSSYDGVYYESWEFVTPSQKTITVYE